MSVNTDSIDSGSLSLAAAISTSKAAPQNQASKRPILHKNARLVCRKQKLKCDGATPSCGRCLSVSQLSTLEQSLVSHKLPQLLRNSGVVDVNVKQKDIFIQDEDSEWITFISPLVKTEESSEDSPTETISQPFRSEATDWNNVMLQRLRWVLLHSPSSVILILTRVPTCSRA